MSNAVALHEHLVIVLAAARARYEAAPSRRTEVAYHDALAELATLEGKGEDAGE